MRLNPEQQKALYNNMIAGLKLNMFKLEKRAKFIARF
jgi:hypothetical protein